jgi:Fe-S-cluster containining protein
MKKRNSLPLFNGVSISKLELEQNGDLHVEFDLPTPTHSVNYRTDIVAKRSFDLYEDEELRDAARALFKLVRKRLAEPDPDRAGIDCMKCQESRCCREYDVLISTADQEVLAEHLKVPLAEVRKKYLTKLNDWTGDFDYELRKDKDDFGPKCVFLARTPQGGTRCTVYEARPALCRDFDEHDCTLFDDQGQALP